MSGGARRLMLLIAVCAAVCWSAGRATAEDGRAGLVIVDADGAVTTRCVATAAEGISGYAALLASGLDVEAAQSGLGSAVCRIGATGCPADDCFCRCRGGAECRYWSYWRQTDGNWQYAPVGAGSTRVRPGAVEGWVWGPGAVNRAAPPPDLTFAEICAEQPATTPAPAAVAATAGRASSPWSHYGWLALMVAALTIALLRTRGGGRSG